MCGLDIDQDGITDVLLVAAPMYLGSGNKEAGRVYIYTLNGVRQQQHGSITFISIIMQTFLSYTTMNDIPVLLLQSLLLPSTHLSLFPPLCVSQEDIFVSNGTLKSNNKSQDARFGYALAPTPDLNHDGFTDLLVGAPLEDEHRGAIYVYHGDGIYVIHNYKQVSPFLQLQVLTGASQNSD